MGLGNLVDRRTRIRTCWLEIGLPVAQRSRHHHRIGEVPSCTVMESFLRQTATSHTPSLPPQEAPSRCWPEDALLISFHILFITSQRYGRYPTENRPRGLALFAHKIPRPVTAPGPTKHSSSQSGIGRNHSQLAARDSRLQPLHEPCGPPFDLSGFHLKPAR